MGVLVGIDEAGFGPILGPLVVSSCTFDVSDLSPANDLWQILGRSLGKTRRRLAGRLLVSDSKKAYSKSVGIRHIERTVLAFLRCLGERPRTLRELLEVLCPDVVERLSEYQWYEGALEGPIESDAADLEIASAVLADDLASNGMSFGGIQSRCLDVQYYNQMVERVKNKANVLFSATAFLINEAFEASDAEKVHVVVDRQGGRVHYREVLGVMFPEMELTILQENAASSSYELRRGCRVMRLHFAVGGDDRFLPVSLASMTSKYIRELLMGCINRYFRRLNPELNRTAGYWKDGLRFIEELRTLVPEVRFDAKRLIRSR